MQPIQSAEDLDKFYEKPDPWSYHADKDDQRRKLELLGALPARRYLRCLDIGCGDGFITFSLPGEQVVGLDVSAKAIEWARQRREEQAQPGRFEFQSMSLFDHGMRELGRFDLIVATGVFYPQYIGRGRSFVRQLMDGMLEQGGILASCHIKDWDPPLFPYHRLDTSIYQYREYTHQLEVYRK